MTDRLTQLQDCFDQLLDRMFMSIHYVTTYHQYGVVEGQVSQDPFSQEQRHTSSSQPASAVLPPEQSNTADPTTSASIGLTSADTTQQQQQQQPAGEGQGGAPKPHDPATFARNLSILSQDLILKEQQIEYLIEKLPGIGTSQKEQEARIVELEGQLKCLDKEKEEAYSERQRLERVLEGVIAGVRRV